MRYNMEPNAASLLLYQRMEKDKTGPDASEYRNAVLTVGQMVTRLNELEQWREAWLKVTEEGASLVNRVMGDNAPPSASFRLGAWSVMVREQLNREASKSGDA